MTVEPVAPAAPPPAPGHHLVAELLPLDSIRPSPNNPRKHQAADPRLAELAESIRRHDVVQPIVVRPLPDANGEPLYELVAGERRWRASLLAFRTQADDGCKPVVAAGLIPALVRHDLDELAALEITVIENLQRQDLRPLEEANGVAALVDRAGWTLEMVADQLARPVAWVRKRQRLRSLSPSWRLAIETEPLFAEWTVRHLEIVCRLEPAGQDDLLTDYTAAEKWYQNERTPTPAALARRVANYTRSLAGAQWDVADVTLVPTAGSCNACPKRSGCHPGLFDEADDEQEQVDDDRCLDAGCWAKKVAATVERKRLQMEAQYGDKLVLVKGHGTSNTTPAAAKTKLNAWQAPEKKGGKVPVLVVSGEDAGRSYFAEAASPGTAPRQPSPEREKAPVKSIEERRKELEVRRKMYATEALQTTIHAISKGEKPPRQPSDRLVLAFAASFGAMAPLVAEEEETEEAYRRFDNFGGDEKAAIAAIWLGALVNVADELAVYHPGQFERAWEVAKRVAAAIAVSLPSLLEEAEKEIPTPKGLETGATAPTKATTGKRVKKAVSA